MKWDETAKLSALRRWLAYRLQNDLVTVDKKPETIATFVALCNKLDTTGHHIHRQQHAGRERKDDLNNHKVSDVAENIKR